ncbi:3-(3-hydroxyphenyl)propionate hydroxylase [Nocardia panacis]|uniref:3-(3-hydroxyphenyl)propionate hydroxylase n=1 Tax=Nocardia panacis TaxID=2340916 RepID=A0A3A4KMG0_9NOCA|nr:FAD-dependent monooxygenase [Nocardia panacis]RJO75216.1 3-(3-hydroxyphenyl)propionate hydroxylase [Nocardia panacis]
MTAIDVLIAGAGPTGLILACDLARRGIRCRVIDRAAGPQAGGRGFGLKPRTLEIMDDLGVADRIAAIALDHTPIRFHLGHTELFELRVPPAAPTPRRPYPNLLSLPQWRTESVLRDRLTELGGQVEFDCELVDFDQDANGVSATLRRGGAVETMRAAWLVGADGGRSTVRRRLGIAFRGRTEDDARALLADVTVHGLADPAAVHLWMGAEGLLVIRPGSDGRCQVVAALAPQDDDAPELDTLRHLVTARSGRADIELTDPTWISVWRYNLRMAERYRVGRVLLAGDAAHVHSPFGAYGMNTGIGDAYNLGWKLAHTVRGADPELLDTYWAERAPIARKILADSDRRFAAATPPPFIRPLVALALKPLLRRAQIRDRADYPAYRTGPLGVEDTARGRGPAVGDSAPDCPLPDGTTLFAHLRGTHFTALVCDAAAPAAEGLEVIEIPPSTALSAHRTFRPRSGSIILIRPDGHIGLITTDPDAVRTYLGRCGLSVAGDNDSQ